MADLIERNNKTNEVMGEGELKQFLIQVAQVIMLCNDKFIFFKKFRFLNINPSAEASAIQLPFFPVYHVHCLCDVA